MPLFPGEEMVLRKWVHCYERYMHGQGSDASIISRNTLLPFFMVPRAQTYQNRKQKKTNKQTNPREDEKSIKPPGLYDSHR